VTKYVRPAGLIAVHQRPVVCLARLGIPGQMRCAAAPNWSDQMKLAAIALGLAVTFVPVSGFAHGEPPPASHGGLMQEAGEMYLELVVKGADVTVYILDETRKPVPGTQATGIATVLVDGKSHKVDLKAAEGNSLHGILPVEATGRVVATVALKVGGRTASARFMPAA